MKKYLVRFSTFFAVVTAVFALCFASAYAADTASIADDLAYVSLADEQGGEVHVQTLSGGDKYLFLPSSADFAAVTLTYDETVFSNVSLSANGVTVDVKSGVAFDFSVLSSSGDEHRVTVNAVTTAGNLNETVTVMKSSKVRTLFFTSDDPVNYGRPYVDASKSNEDASGSALVVAADGTVDFSGVVKEIKGRGNTTFEKFAKKPYQIKLDKKTELVDGAGKSKKWILLANAADPTLIRNSITFAAAEQLGMEYNCKFEPVDLYYDGEYRGSYLLTEKVEIGDGRIEISETDDLIEDENKDNPAYEEPVTKTVAFKDGTTELKGDAAGSVRYVEGLNEPAFPEGSSHHAYLLEFELDIRYPDELTGFVTNRRQRIVTKTPEYLTKDQGMYIANFWQEFEDAVYSKDGYNAKTGKYYYEYCDLDSLAKCYLLNEYNKNCDYYGSSTFFYLPENSDMFTCGPLWDYDLAYGIGYDLDRDSIITKPEYFYVGANSFPDALLKIQSFRDAVKKLASPDGEVYKAVKALTGENGTIRQYASLVNDSQRMNFMIWDIANCAMPAVSQDKNITYAEAVDNLDSFVGTRLDWISAEIAKWNGSDYQLITEPEKKLTLLEKIFAFIEMVLDFLRSLFD